MLTPKLFLVLIISIALLTQPIHTLQRNLHKQSPNHKVTTQCCQQKGGKTCGTIVQDCCKNQCQSGFLHTEWCKNNEALVPICQTCTSICKRQGGIPCQVSVDNGKVSCCAVQNCVKVSKNQTQGGSVAGGIGDTILKYATSSIIGAALAHHQLADAIIEKFKGPNNYCKADTEIDLGNCTADSFLELVSTKILN